MTPEKVTDWLRRAGSLRDGSVSTIHVNETVDTWVSRLFFLTASYTDAPDLPTALVIKMPSASALEASPDANRKEAQFYGSLAPTLDNSPTVRCFAALEPHDDEPAILVLEDVRATHHTSSWPSPPSDAECESAIDTLAQIHAHWFRSPELGSSIDSLHTEHSLREMVHAIAVHLPDFKKELGDSLTSRARNIYDRVFNSDLKPWLNLVHSRALTVARGDAHAWNFVFPRSATGPALLLDWQRWHIDVGARDLAFMMALHWYPSRRSELERPLLQRYHDELLRRGVAGYSFDDLLLDYRRSAVRNLTLPLIFWRRGMKPEKWWHRLECAISAYEDLECDELL